MILSSAYFPPIEYFSLILDAVRRGESVCVDRTENYVKQSYRNRCRILSSNGPLDLNFPIVHNGKKRISEVEVDYSTPWLHKTEYAIESAYFNSPFFEYYRDALFAVLDSRPATVWELDMAVTGFFCARMGLSPIFTDIPAGKDFRESIHPKRPPLAVNPPYWQVFREKFGFVPNLSVMDLLFNEGPESLSFLTIPELSK